MSGPKPHDELRAAAARPLSLLHGALFVLALVLLVRWVVSSGVATT